MLRNLIRTLSHLPGTELLPGRIKALLRASGNPPILPTMLNIEPTRRCNLRCAMCHFANHPKDVKADMTLGDFERIVSQFPDTLQKVTIQGLGEPLLNRSLLEMVEFCRGRGLETRFNTNMTIMNPEIAERLVRCGHSEVQVSLETTDPTLYADIRRGAKLERVMRNLAMLIETKQRLGSEWPHINVHGILMKAILPTIPNMVARLQSAGIHDLYFSDLVVATREQLRDGTTMADNAFSATMSEAEIASALRDIKSLETPDFHISVPGEWFCLRNTSKADAGILTCRELWEAPYVTCDGYATPCCVVPDPTVFNLGNYKESSFGAIWFGEPYQRLRLSHILNRHPAACRGCARLVCTFVDPSHLKTRPEAQERYTKCFVGHRFIARHFMGAEAAPATKDLVETAQQAQAEKPGDARGAPPRTQRIIDSKKGRLAGPWEMVLYPTNRCNLKCAICWQRWAIEEFGKVDTENEVPDERWMSLIDEGAKLDVREWIIVGGGEPMIRRDLVLNMAKKICKLGMTCTLHTNGTMLATDPIERLVDMGLEHIVFSIDAADRETNDDIRSAGSFERATTAIRKLVETKRKKEKTKPDIRIAGVLTSTNYTKVRDFVRVFHESGCDGVTLATLAEQGSSTKRFALTPEQLPVAIDNVRDAMELALDLGIATNFDVLLRRLEGEISRELVAAQACTPIAEGMCFEPWSSMIIQPNGITGPCCVSYDEQAPSIATASLNEIWTGPYFEMLRERAAKSQPLPYCELCPMHLLERTRCMKEEMASEQA